MSTRSERNTSIKLLSARWLCVLAVDENLVDVVVIRAGQEAVNAVGLEGPLAVLGAGDVFEPGVGAFGLAVGTVGFDVSSIGAGGSDGVVGIDVDDLAGDDGVLFQGC